jgi:hypothetical protein
VFTPCPSLFLEAQKEVQKRWCKATHCCPLQDLLTHLRVCCWVSLAQFSSVGRMLTHEALQFITETDFAHWYLSATPRHTHIPPDVRVQRASVLNRHVLYGPILRAVIKIKD